MVELPISLDVTPSQTSRPAWVHGVAAIGSQNGNRLSFDNKADREQGGYVVVAGGCFLLIWVSNFCFRLKKVTGLVVFPPVWMNIKQGIKREFSHAFPFLPLLSIQGNEGKPNFSSFISLFSLVRNKVSILLNKSYTTFLRILTVMLLHFLPLNSVGLS